MPSRSYHTPPATPAEKSASHSLLSLQDGLASVTGRGTIERSDATFNPSSLTAYSSASIASSGVWVGMTAAGVKRSENSAKYSAQKVLKARHVARRVSASGI